MNRRSFIRNTALSVSGLALLELNSNMNIVLAAENVSISDGMAKSLQYVEDANNAAARTNKEATCQNCQFYSGAKEAQWGPCSIFAGKKVKATGWCTAWSA